MKTIFKLIGFFVTSIGFFWSHLDLIRIYFSCKAKDDVFPEYFAAFPFIYKSQSLATSMANEYYLLGIILNSIIQYFAKNFTQQSFQNLEIALFCVYFCQVRGLCRTLK